MSDLSERTYAAIASLVEGSHHARPDDVPRLALEAGGRLGADAVVVYLVDYDQRLLIPLLDPESKVEREVLPVEGTLAGRVFIDVQVKDGRSPAQATVWSPLVDGTERLGVVEFAFAPDTSIDVELRTSCRRIASVIAELTMTRASYGDLLERVRRTLPMSMPAELQMIIRAPLTFATDRIVISGILAPPYAVAGDTFDYAVNGETAHLAVFDAMGHGLEAALLATVALAAYRNARRCGLELVDTAWSIDRWIGSQFGPDRFVTATLGELDTDSGLWQWVTAGHPPALLLRRGRIVKVLDQVVSPPLGLFEGRPPTGEERLEPGDRLLLYTDGVTEARDANGQFFGLDRLADLVAREAASALPAPEVLRRLNQAILTHQAGRLQDDATTLFVEWLGEGTRHVLPHA